MRAGVNATRANVVLMLLVLPARNGREGAMRTWLRVVWLVLPAVVWPAVLVLAPLSSLARPALASTAGFAVGRGDANGDGVVDGLDALYVLRQVFGRGPVDEAAVWRGDVHPFPGTEGRLMGDGRLTLEDARMLLRYHVGAASRGEVTGAFERPVVTRLEPAHGAPGDRVTVVGTGFVPGRPEDNLVRFGDWEAEVLQATGTALTVTVPYGVVRAPVSVTGPGGTAFSDFEFIVSVARPLRLVPPAGLQPGDYEVVNAFLEDAVADGHGGVVLPVSAQGLTTHFAVPRDGSSRLLLAVDIVDASTAGKVAAQPAPLDIASTARALVFQCPHLVTSVPERARLTMEVIAVDPRVAALAELMETLYAAGVDVPDDPRYLAAYQAAVRSVLDRLPPEAVADFEAADQAEAAGKALSPPSSSWAALAGTALDSARPAARVAAPSGRQSVQAPAALEGFGTGPLTMTVLYPDAAITSAGEMTADGRVPVRGVSGNPLDWLVHLTRVAEPRQVFPHGWEEVHGWEFRLDEAGILPRDYGFPESIAFLESSSWTSYLDVFGTAFGAGWDVTTDMVGDITGGKGMLTPDNSLHVDPHEDAVYVVRGYSGVMFDARFTGKNSLVDMLPGGIGGRGGAIALNVLMAGSDFFAGWLGGSTEALLSGAGIDIKVVMRRSMRTVVRRSVKVVMRKLPRGVRSLSGRTDAWKMIGSLIYDAVFDFTGTFLAEIPKAAADMVQAGTMTREAAGALTRNTGLLRQGVTTGLRFVAGAIDIGYKASMLGSAGERGVALLLGVHWMPITPLETWLLVVGDPFNPRISAFEPDRGSTGRRVVIRGRRFEPNPGDNRVTFGDWTVKTPAKVLEASPNRLVVEVPRLPEGTQAHIMVQTPGGRFQSEDTFLIQRSPLITGIEPTVGYIPNPEAFGGEGFAGTRLTVYGEDFSTSAQPPDQVSFSGAWLMPAGSIDWYRNRYEVTVSPGPYRDPLEVSSELYTGTQVEVFVDVHPYFEEYFSNRLPFTVLGPPTLTHVEPPVVRAGESISLLGSGFSPNALELRVYLSWTGEQGPETVTLLPYQIERRSYVFLRVPVPHTIPEGVTVGVQVETPAGLTEMRTFERAAGMEVETPADMAAGYTIHITTRTGGTEPDGALSLSEALAFAAGTLDPYAPPWDDLNEYEYRHRREQHDYTDTEGNVYYDWVDGRVDRRTEPGGPGTEFRSTYLVSNYADGLIDTKLVRTVSLDQPPHGAMEEGDYVSGVEGGAGWRDQIRVDNSLTGGRITLSEATTIFGDLLDLRGFTLHLQEPLTLAGGAIVRADSIIGPAGVIIKGSGNELSGGAPFYVVMSGIEGDAVTVLGSAGGLHEERVDGDNSIWAHVRDCSGAGVVIRDSHKNNFTGSVIGVGGDGIVIEDGEENDLRARTGFTFGPAEIGRTGGSGVVVRGGGRNSLRVAVAEAGDHGVWLDETQATHVLAASIHHCGGDGLRITGGGRNTAYIADIAANDGAGVRLHGGTVENVVSESFASDQTTHWHGNATGVAVLDAGTAHNRIQVRHLVHSSGDGLLLGDGASFNTIHANIDSSARDGVVLTGAGTMHNVLSGQINASGRHGLHLSAGTSGNTVQIEQITDSGGHGVHIIDAGTDDNTLAPFNRFTTLRLHRNAGAGIRMIGDGTSGPAGNNVVAELEDNAVFGVWVSGVAPPVGKQNTLLFTNISGSNTGIQIDGGTRRLRVAPAFPGQQALHITGATTGIVLAGDGTDHNTIDGGYHDLSRPNALFTGIHIEGPTATGVRVTANARHNVLTGIRIDHGTGTGWLLDGGVGDTHIMGSSVVDMEGDAVVLDGVGGVAVADVRTERCRRGLVLRNGAHNIVVDGRWTEHLNHQLEGVYIGGAETREVRLHRGRMNANAGAGIRVTDGAVDVTLGDPGAESSVLQLLDNLEAAVRLDGGVRQVGIHGAFIRSSEEPFSPGIVVEDGVTEVRIGAAHAPRRGGFEAGVNIGGAEPAVLIRGQDVADIRIVNSLFGEIPPTESGVVVRDGARNVTIGGPGWAANQFANYQHAAILAAGAGTQVIITGNRIGHNRTGVVLTEGISQARVSGNRIWSNDAQGILVDNGANDNEIGNNTLLMNLGGAVELRDAHANVVIGNDIQDNIGGIRVSAGARTNTLRGNVITGNAGKGIELLDGANDGLPAPVIDEFSVEQQRIRGHVDGSVPAGSLVDVFADYGNQGEIHVGTTRTTGSRFALRKPIPPGMRLNAIVTDPAGNTSEFGVTEAAVAVAARPPRIVYTVGETDSRGTVGSDGRSAIWALLPGADEPVRLTDPSMSAHSPLLSPDGRRVVFVAAPDGHRDLFMVSVEGGAVHRLTAHPAEDFDPAWAPDGRRLAFVSDRAGAPDVHILPVGLRLFAGELGYDDGEAELDVVLDTLGVGVDFEVPAAGATVYAIRMLLQEPLAPLAWAVLDYGDEAVLASGVTTPEEAGWFDIPVLLTIRERFLVHLAAVNDDGPAPVLGADLSGSARRSYVYTPQGRRLVTDNYMIRVQVEPAVTSITADRHTQREPAWSPDGTELVFASDAAGSLDLYVITLDGGAVRRLTQEDGDARRPQWSRTGDIAFTLYRGDEARAWSITADGAHPRPLVGREGRTADPVWGPDGQLLFVADWDGDWELYRQLPTGVVRRLTALLGPVSGPHVLE